MSVAFDVIAPSSTTQVSTASTVTWTHTAGTGANVVLVFVTASDFNIAGTMTCKYGGASMTLLGSQPSGNSADDAGSIYCFGITTGAAGANTVLATYSRTPSKALLGVSLSFTGGASLGTPVLAGIANGASKTSGTAVLSSTTSGGMVAAGVCTGSSFTSFSGPTGITQRWKENHDTSTGAGCTGGATVPSTGSSMTVGWTESSDIYGAIAVEVKPGSTVNTESGPLTLTLPKPVISIASRKLISGSFTPALPKPAVAISSRKLISGSFSLTLPAPTTSIASRRLVSGSLSLVLPAPSVAIASTSAKVISGDFSIALPAPSVAISSRKVISGDLNLGLPVPALDIASRKLVSGSFGLVLPAPALDIASRKLISGGFAPVLPAPSVDIASRKLISGSLSIELPLPVVSLASTSIGGISGGPSSISGTFDLVLPAISVAIASRSWHVAASTTVSLTPQVNSGSIEPSSTVSGGTVTIQDTGAVVSPADTATGSITPGSTVSGGSVTAPDTGGTVSSPDTGGAVSRESTESGDIAPDSAVSGGSLQSLDEGSSGTVTGPAPAEGSISSILGGGDITPVAYVSGGTVQSLDTGGSTSSPDSGAAMIGPVMQQTAITLNEFDDQTFNATLTLNGSAEDLTDCTVNMVFKTAAGVSDTDPSSLILSSGGDSPAITVTNAAAGQCAVAIPNADLQTGSYGFYKIVVIDASSLKTTYVYGSVSWIKL